MTSLQTDGITQWASLLLAQAQGVYSRARAAKGTNE